MDLGESLPGLAVLRVFLTFPSVVLWLGNDFPFLSPLVFVCLQYEERSGRDFHESG